MRNPNDGLCVAVTGACGYIGRKVIYRLAQEAYIAHIVAIDVIPLGSISNKKISFFQRDISTSIGEILSENDVDAIVHLAFVLNPGEDRALARRINIDSTKVLIQDCIENDVGHVVYLSSSTVYGAHKDNPEFLDEETPLRPVEGFLYGEHKVKAETTIQKCIPSNDKGPRVTVLRACPVLGPNADNYIAKTFNRTILVRLKRADPPMQFLHEDDLAEIIVRSILNRTAGTYNVAGDGTVNWSTVAEITGKVVFELPEQLLYTLIKFSWNLRLQKYAPPTGLNFIRYPWTVSTDKVKRDFGFRFRYSSLETLKAFAQIHSKIK